MITWQFTVRPNTARFCHTGRIESLRTLGGRSGSRVMIWITVLPDRTLRKGVQTQRTIRKGHNEVDVIQTIIARSTF